VTSGSLSIQDGGKSLRAACAAFRGAPEKSPQDYRLVGTSAARLDLPAKFAGKASYLQDMKLPGMLHGRMVRPFFPFKKLLSLEIPKDIKVIRDGNFVGVLAETETEAIAAQKQLRARAKWESGAEASAPDSH